MGREKQSSKGRVQIDLRLDIFKTRKEVMILSKATEILQQGGRIQMKV